jgi:hypothetical protein
MASRFWESVGAWFAFCLSCLLLLGQPSEAVGDRAGRATNAFGDGAGRQGQLVSVLLHVGEDEAVQLTWPKTA